eukprot:3349203-Amphidinium_carterae.1
MVKGPIYSSTFNQPQPVSTTGDVIVCWSLTFSLPTTHPQPHEQSHLIHTDDIAVFTDVGLDCGSHRLWLHLTSTLPTPSTT